MLQEAEFIRKSIRQVNRFFEKSIQKHTEQVGFTVPQVRVMREVVSQQSLSIKQLSQNLQMTQSSVSGIVDRLTEKGVLQKKPNRYDRRAVEITPTEDVIQFLEKEKLEFVNQTAVDVLSRLKPQEQETVLEGLRLLLDTVQHVDEEKGNNPNERT